MDTVYVVSFYIERKGYHPRILQGIYVPREKQPEIDARLEVYQAVHKRIVSESGTEQFKMKITDFKKMPLDFVYSPGMRGREIRNMGKK